MTKLSAAHRMPGAKRELLCESNLTAEIALKKARAVEVVLKDTEGMYANS